MKISEFIERFNELDTPYPSVRYKISATKEESFAHGVKEESFAHGVVINVFKNNKFAVTAARLPEGVNNWDFYGGAPFSPKMLELMIELANTPPEEREEQPKYVILNSELRHHQHWDYFKIGDKNQYLILRSTRDPKTLKMGSYTIEELEKEKRWLPEKWRDAIDSMLTPLDIALEEGKGVPETDRTIEVKKDDDLD